MKLVEFRLATFNLFNLNEPGKRMYKDAAGWTTDEYNLKIAWSAHQLRLLNPHLVGFQELWHAQSLGNILQASGLAAEYDVLTPPDADGTKIVCAAIVKKGLVVGEPEWITSFPDKFVLQSNGGSLQAAGTSDPAENGDVLPVPAASVLQAAGDDPQTPAISVSVRGFSRPILHFTVLPRSDRRAVHVYVCHFKSKAPTVVHKEKWYREDSDAYGKHATALGAAISTIRRTAEAAGLRFLLTEQMKGNDIPVIVLGDINDGQHSNTLNILTEQPRYLVGDSVGGGDVALYTAQTLQEYRDTRDVYYTHVHQDLRESLDHILVSQEFYDNSRKRVWLFSGMAINNDHLNSEDHKATGTNDHGIVQVTFSYKPIKAV